MTVLTSMGPSEKIRSRVPPVHRQLHPILDGCILEEEKVDLTNVPLEKVYQQP